ncbi:MULTISPECIES: type III secretion system co-regulatory protein PtrC [Pseudomonas]|jgi:hypothetical protein|uniref:type III secretion system co-regulatory protein PtrC n=1 Tax=Pseudomonas TaxID=286 RepID=UPI0008548BA9|nr:MULTISPECIES: type III secretion system co-regulatory protein PtrC [Pseudomonas]MAB97295.1 hypothetical protein [Pseudomonadaceae bacterium]NRH26167.1 hypothetical protein [Pseudomonas sp. MS19]OEO23362.1 hypothetical protein AX279_23925 [Pseudomonas sp. J237]SFU06919.1 hypothetical protein SAMN05216264_11051 [Pseudomonas marincola]
MTTAQWFAAKDVYGVTYATINECGIHYESELAVQLSDGQLTTLSIPTQLSERLAIEQLVCPRTCQ